MTKFIVTRVRNVIEAVAIFADNETSAIAEAKKAKKKSYAVISDTKRGAYSAVTAPKA